MADMMARGGGVVGMTEIKLSTVRYTSTPIFLAAPLVLFVHVAASSYPPPRKKLRHTSLFRKLCRLLTAGCTLKKNTSYWYPNRSLKNMYLLLKLVSPLCTVGPQCNGHFGTRRCIQGHSQEFVFTELHPCLWVTNSIMMMPRI